MRPSDCWEVEKAKGRPVLNVEDIRNERFLAFGRVILYFLIFSFSALQVEKEKQEIFLRKSYRKNVCAGVIDPDKQGKKHE